MLLVRQKVECPERLIGVAESRYRKRRRHPGRLARWFKFILHHLSSLSEAQCIHVAVCHLAGKLQICILRPRHHFLQSSRNHGATQIHRHFTGHGDHNERYLPKTKHCCSRPSYDLPNNLTVGLLHLRMESRYSCVAHASSPDNQYPIDFCSAHPELSQLRRQDRSSTRSRELNHEGRLHRPPSKKYPLSSLHMLGLAGHQRLQNGCHVLLQIAQPTAVAIAADYLDL